MELVKILDSSNNIVDVVRAYEELEIIQNSDGLDTMSLTVKLMDSTVKYLVEETTLFVYGSSWTIKGVSRDNSNLYLECKLNLDIFNEVAYSRYQQTNKYLSENLDLLLTDSGWTWGYSPAYVEVSEDKMSLDVTGLNKLQVMTALQSLFQCMFRYNNDTKHITVTRIADFMDNGVYFTDELNIISMDYSGDSYDLVTRVIPIGADGITIESVNEGLNYLDSNVYTDKVITKILVDDSAIEPEELMERGIDFLDEYSTPSRSYKVSVLDLASINEDYSFLTTELGTYVTLLDRITESSIKHLVTQRTIYPNNPNRNVVDLVTVVGVIQDVVNKNSNSVVSIEETTDSISFAVRNSLLKFSANTGLEIINGGFAIKVDEFNTGEYETVLYFDPIKRRYQITGAVDISGTLTSDATVTDSLYASNGVVSELTVDSVSTADFTARFLNSDTSDVDYIDIDDNWTYYYNAKTDGVSVQHASNRYNELLYWQEDISSATIVDGAPYIEGKRILVTIEDTGFPVEHYVYDILAKRSSGFDDDGIVFETYGAGTSEDPSSFQGKGKITKNLDTFQLEKYSDTEEELSSGVYLKDTGSYLKNFNAGATKFKFYEGGVNGDRGFGVKYEGDDTALKYKEVVVSGETIGLESNFGDYIDIETVQEDIDITSNFL